jgi:hypothetical protein
LDLPEKKIAISQYVERLHAPYQRIRFFTPEFALEFSKFQNSEYEMHQSSSNGEGLPKSQI